jgi:hypothetical protein
METAPARWLENGLEFSKNQHVAWKIPASEWFQKWC